MFAVVPEFFHDLLQAPTFATISTIMPDGSPQSSVVWIDFDGEYILINTAAGRRKERNMRARPQVSIVGFDSNVPLRYIEVRGIVEEITAEGGVAHADKLAKAYEGVESYYGNISPVEKREKETRLVCKIRPVHVVTYEESRTPGKSPRS